MNKIKGFFKRVFSPVVNMSRSHSGTIVATMITAILVSGGINPQTATQAGRVAGEIYEQRQGVEHVSETHSRPEE